ncbi:MAG: SPFH domain-containing protein [Candidatus Aenigmarchaeota archaeon]
MAMEWEREANTIAERFKKEEIPGFLTKEFLAKDNEFVVVERGKEIYRERGPGKFAISSFAGDLTNIILVDKSEKTLENEIKNVWLADEKKIDIKLVIKFRIFHSDRFSKNLMGEKKRLSLQDVWDETISDVIYKRSLPELEKNPAKEFLREDFREKARGDMESDMKNSFEKWGLILTSLSVDFKIPEGIEAEKSEKIEVEKSEPGKPEGGTGEGAEEKGLEGVKKYETEMGKEKELPEKES